MNEHKNTVAAVLNTREARLEIVVVAFILTFGINLASTNVVEYWDKEIFLVGLAGWFLIFIAIGYLLIKLGKSLSSKTIVSAVVVIDVKENSILDIPGYDFSGRMKKVFDAAFLENPAYLNIWNKFPLFKKSNVIPIHVQSVKNEGESSILYSAIYESENPVIKNETSMKLLNEAIEYVLIESISDQLSDYFGFSNNSDSKIKKFNKKDIPEVLLSNRFLYLFTTPLEERLIYSKLNSSLTEQGVNLKSISGSDGSFFTSLGIYLPKDSSIKRPKDGVLTLSSDRAIINLSFEYAGEKHVSPDHFIELYLGKNPSNIELLKINIVLDVSIKWMSLFKFDNWKYYRWIDRLPFNIFENSDFKFHIKKINWPQVRAQARVGVISSRFEERARKREEQRKLSEIKKTEGS